MGQRTTTLRNEVFRNISGRHGDCLVVIGSRYTRDKAEYDRMIMVRPRKEKEMKTTWQVATAAEAFAAAQ